MDLSIILASYNRRDYIIGALDSLYRQTLPKESFEVFVVDNNSQDDTEALCKQYIADHPDASIHFLMEKRQGASFARNTGAAKARGKWLVFMDDDALAYPDFLQKIIAFYRTHVNAGGLGGRIIPKYIPSEPRWMSRYVSSMVGNFDYSPETVEFAPLGYPLESNMVISKSDFDMAGGFNTSLPGVSGNYRIGGEGKALFYKLKAMGRTIWYDPNVIVEHVVEVNKLTREYLYRVASGQGRGDGVRTRALGKGAYYKKIVVYVFKLAGSIIIGLGYALGGKPSKSLPVIRFKWDALRGLLDSAHITL
jgi:glycosyltransferase involved in cell wall biosynthesis